MLPYHSLYLFNAYYSRFTWKLQIYWLPLDTYLYLKIVTVLNLSIQAWGSLLKIFRISVKTLLIGKTDQIKEIIILNAIARPLFSVFHSRAISLPLLFKCQETYLAPILLQQIMLFSSHCTLNYTRTDLTCSTPLWV